MSTGHIMPMTKLGKWGFGLILTAVVLVAASMLIALSLRSEDENTAYNLLGMLGPAFILVAFAAIVISWIAILKFKDRGILLIICASVLTALALFFGVGEIVEAIMISGGNS